MGFSSDILNLNFKNLYDENMARRIHIYRYKVKNYKTTLNKILIKPRRSIILLLEDEKLIECVLDNSTTVKSTVTISSSQTTGTSELFLNDQITLISNTILPEDYSNEFYIYSLIPIVEKQLNTNDLYLDQIGSTTHPNFQEYHFKGLKNSDKKNINLITLTKLKNKTAGTTTNIYSYFNPEIDFFDANKNIILKSPGPISDFSVKFLDINNHYKQMEYNLVEDNSHAYGLIQMQPTKLNPDITFSSDTYDTNKNINFNLAKYFIRQPKSIKYIWNERGYSLDDSSREATAAKNLYFAFLTIVFLSEQRLRKYSDYLIDDKSSSAFGSIDFTKLKDKLYGITASDLNIDDQKILNGSVLKIWERQFSSELTFSKQFTNNNLGNLYIEIKALLAGLSESIPSPYSFGNYSKLGRLAMEWYFIPSSEINLDDIVNLRDYNVQLESLKYEFDSTKQTISGLKSDFLKISGTKTFNLDGQITLPSVPEILTEESKNSSAGGIDISNTNFLNYLWYFQLSDKSKYINLFSYENLPQGTKQTNSKTINDNLFGGKTGTLTGIEVIDYIVDNLVLPGRSVIGKTAKVFIIKKTVRTFVGYNTINPYFDRGPEPIFKFEIVYSNFFTWTEEITTTNVNRINTPFSINQAQWEIFESTIGLNESEFELKPILLNNSEKKQITEVQWKNTFSNYSEIILPVKLKDGTDSTISFTLEQAFKRDQTITQEGLLI